MNFYEFYVCVKPKRVSNVNMSVPKSKFEEHFTNYVFGSCMFLGRTQAEGCLVYIASTNMKKYIKIFRIIGGYNSCRKVKYIKSTHFYVVISTKMLIGNNNFVFKYPDKGKQKVFNISIFLLKFWVTL